MSAYTEAVARGRARHGERYREPAAAATFGPLLGGPRVRVRFADGSTLTGTIGLTTGWRPSFLLMRRSSDMGSPWLLGDGDTIEAVQYGRTYRPTLAAMEKGIVR